MSESLYIPLTLGAVLTALLHRESSHRRRYAVLTGFLIGLIALTRGNGIALLLPVVALVWTERPWRSWKALRSPLVVAAATLVTLVPWTLRNAVLFHAFIPVSTQSGYALAGTYSSIARANTLYPGLWRPPFKEMLAIHTAHPSFDEAQISAELRDQGLNYVWTHPGYFFKEALTNSERLLNLTGPGLERDLARFESYDRQLAELSVYTFWVIAALALAGASTRAARRAPAALWACPIVLALPTILFLGATRYRSPADPFVVMLAALALLAATGRLQRASPPVAGGT
jgi:4-amino-4-deoxy-L-arabinose transferase-like glycosyltransferase